MLLILAEHICHLSRVAPVMYAHLAAAQMATSVKFEDSSRDFIKPWWDHNI
ncbi:hypothetical protein Bca4012_045598 [Brassica carinata]